LTSFTQYRPCASRGRPNAWAASGLVPLAALAVLAWTLPALAQGQTNSNTSPINTSSMWNGTIWNSDGLNHSNPMTTDPFGGVTDPIDGVIGWGLGSAGTGAPSFRDHVNITVNSDLTATGSIGAYSVTAVGSLASTTLTDNTLIFDSTVGGGTASSVGGSAYAAAVQNLTGTSEVSRNTLRFQTASAVAGWAGGGAVVSGKVDGNSVSVVHSTGAVTARGFYGGVGRGGGTITGNTVTISGAGTTNASYAIVGAQTNGNTNSVITGNSVTVLSTAGDVTANLHIAGAYVTGQGSAGIRHTISENTVTLHHGSVTSTAPFTGFVAGAYANNGDSGLGLVEVQNATFSENKVTILGDVEIAGGLYGAAATEESTAFNIFTKNGVELTAGSITSGTDPVDHIYGAYGHSGRAEENYVELTPTGDVTVNGTGTWGGNVAGAAMREGGASTSLTKNRAVINSGTGTVAVQGSVYGAATGNGTATENTAEVYGAATVGQDVAGAKASGSTGAMTGNMATVGSTANAFTGKINGAVYGAFSENATGNAAAVTGNTATVVRGVLSNSAGTGHAAVYGGRMSTNGNGNVSGNFATVSESSTVGNVYGGRLDAAGTGTGGSVTENEVSVTGSSTAGTLYGGYLGTSGTGSVTGNKVSVIGSTVGAVYGGYLQSTGTGAGEASENIILFDSGTATDGSVLGGNVYGGYVAAGSGRANKNTVTFRGKTSFAENINPSVYGGFSPSASPGNLVTGNTLVFEQFSHAAEGQTFGTIANFSTINFLVPSNQEGPVIRATAVDLTVDAGHNADMQINIVPGGDHLYLGQEIQLMQTPAGGIKTAPDAPATITVHGYYGISTEYTYEISVNDTATPGDSTLGAKVTAVNFLEYTKALSELPLANAAFVNRGGDDIANKGLPSASAAALGANGLAAFMSIGYGKERFETGSHIDLKGLTGNLGVAVGTENEAGSAVGGIFLEFGEGEYDSYNDFAALPSIHGNGDNSYIGGGLLGRFELGASDRSRPYVEGSARIGKTKSDWSSSTLRRLTGFDAHTEMSAKYYGFHAGLGYIMDFLDFNKDGSLDVSAKYFFTHRDGDDVISTGERMSISSVSSHRLRTGARLNIGFNEFIRPYVGGYFEKEFRGESRVTVGDAVLPEASLEGNTGIGELGVSLSSATVPIEVEIGIQGSGGERKGIAGGLKLNYTF
jgi:hypothetical protein